MSVSSSIDFKYGVKNPNVSILDIIKALNDYGWNFGQEKEYLPLGDDDSFDWVFEKINDEELFNILKAKEEAGEIVAVNMFWQNSDTGGSFLFWNLESFSVNLNINRRCTANQITDVTWYFEKIILALNDLELSYESFSFNEHT